MGGGETCYCNWNRAQRLTVEDKVQMWGGSSQSTGSSEGGEGVSWVWLPRLLKLVNRSLYKAAAIPSVEFPPKIMAGIQEGMNESRVEILRPRSKREGNNLKCKSDLRRENVSDR